MKKHLFALIMVATILTMISCGTTSIAESTEDESIQAPKIEENKEQDTINNKEKESKKEKSKSEFDENGLPIGNYVLMEDFEDGNYWMPVGSSWDDGDLSIDDETTEEWGTNGPTSLKCLYKTNHGEFEKSGYYCDAPLETDWTGAKYLLIDVNNPNDYDISIDIVLQTGENWEWNQAEPQVCSTGISTLVFDISSFTNKEYIARMIVYLFGTPDDNGYFFFDNLRVVF